MKLGIFDELAVTYRMIGAMEAALEKIESGEMSKSGMQRLARQTLAIKARHEQAMKSAIAPVPAQEARTV